LLTWRLSPEWKDFVLGDLEEEFLARAAIAPAAARRWFWRQAIRCAAKPPRHAVRTAYQSRPSGDPFMRTLISDARHALRVFVVTPSYALAVTAVLALGIGATTAIFSIVNAVLLRSLPFDQPDRLVRLFHIPPQSAFPGIATFSLSPANFLDWQRDSQSFEAMSAYHGRSVTLTGGSNPEALRIGTVGPDFFRVVRTQPALGRSFAPEEYEAERSRVLVVSDAFWKSHLGGSRDAIGRVLSFDGESYTVVGVMPPQFTVKAWGVGGLPMWAPLSWTAEEAAVRENHNLQAIARLKDGVTLEQARAELAVISQRLEKAYPAENAGWGGTAIPLQELLVGDVRRSLLILLGAVGLVLLIACANVGNLILARSMTRRKEIAIRTALGAGRRRVFQHLIVESIVLSIAGGALGLALAHLAVSAGTTALETQIPRAGEASIDTMVLLFTFAASILTGLLAGVLPALRAGRPDLNETLKEGGRTDASGAGSLTRRALIVAEVALSLILLMGAGVMLRSLHALRGVDAGFNPGQVLKLDVSVPDARYPKDEQKTLFYNHLLDRLRALPGVESAGWVDTLPVTGGGSVQPLVIEGRAELSPRDQPTVSVRLASEEYVKTMQIPILRGRDVARVDGDAMLVSVSAAKLLWGDQDPIGRRATLPLISRTNAIPVVGIVGDVKEQLAENAPPTVYYHMKAMPFGDASIAIRAAGDPTALARAATAEVRALDPQLPVQRVQSMDQVLDEVLVAERFRALLLQIFAGAALILASVGIYSVLSYLVRGRRREIGIRAALGARTVDLLGMVLIEGLKPALLGIVIGIAGALMAASLLDKLVFGVKASDPLTLALVAGALLIVSIAASLLPAWRATRLDPLTVLRDS
jgi:putative ABC transport system permease protein